MTFCNAYNKANIVLPVACKPIKNTLCDEQNDRLKTSIVFH